MIWRPWIIISLLIVAVLIDALLVVNERLPLKPTETELSSSNERLKNIQYTSGTRRANFEVMGMSPDLANDTANQFSRFAKQTEKFKQLLDEQSSELFSVLCPSELPQPYSALAYLVYEENGTRYVVEPDTLRQFERQPWFDASLVPALYNEFERTPNRRNEATIMAISAVLLNREGAALDGESPWSRSALGSWGFARLEKREPKVRRLVIEYFALMHFLTELANTEKGICP